MFHVKRGSDWSGYVVIHASYAELSACAESLCDLCMFFLRECWYRFRLWEEGSYQDIVEGTEGSIAIRSDITDGRYQYWFISLGHRTTPITCSLYGHLEGPPKTTREFQEIREANPPLEWSLEKCKNWLSYCLSYHKYCGQRGTSKSRFLPTRLLDVGHQKQQWIRLVLSKDLEDSIEAIYTTLSYCWGATNDTARTTKENLNNRLEGIQVESLPQTLQDAIAVTRGLGVQYLWIDALCIIQEGTGENNDWEKELLDMGEIYGRSLLTIAASSASSSEAGFLCRRNGAYWPVRHHYLWDNHDKLIFKAFLPTWEYLYESLPLSKRGWALQERMLASRTLSWTDHGTFWLCGEEHTSEYMGPYSGGLHIDQVVRMLHDICMDVKPSVTTSTSHAQTDSSSEFRRDYTHNSYDGPPYLSKWYELIEELSKRSFTVASDRVPAITGLGKEIASFAGTKFVNGMFRPSSARELCWVVHSFLSVRQIPGIPSWSWASTDQRVFFRSLINFQLLARGAIVDSQQIHICSRLGSLPVTSTGDVDSRLKWISPRRKNPDPVIIFDTEQDAPPWKAGRVRCVQWVTWPCELVHLDKYVKYLRQDHRMLGVILVTAVNKKRHVYRRIGWAKVFNDNCFDKDTTNITLI
jgi:hypothetical protein